MARARHGPAGVDAKGRTQRLRAYLVLLYCLGLSHRSVEQALAPLGVHVDPVSVWRALQELGTRMQARAAHAPYLFVRPARSPVM